MAKIAFLKREYRFYGKNSHCHRYAIYNYKHRITQHELFHDKIDFPVIFPDCEKAFKQNTLWYFANAKHKIKKSKSFFIICIPTGCFAPVVVQKIMWVYTFRFLPIVAPLRGAKIVGRASTAGRRPRWVRQPAATDIPPLRGEKKIMLWHFLPIGAPLWGAKKII
ncbi:MAG: hypothetical protein LBU70_07610 [Chitinispirillales bacterium]|nr:hypothetical protein [Chitinispirillales bacterium]